MNDDALISLSGIHMARGGRQLLIDIGLRVPPREILTIIGPNGAGKSTLLRVALGLQRPDSGTVERQRNLRIGYMPQKLHLNALMPVTVRRFLQMAPATRRGSEQRMIDEALTTTGVYHLANQPIHSISGGETQRVLLARALLSKPQLLALDEPAQGVDITGQTELYQLIGHLRDEYHCAVLMVSHDLHLVMAKTDSVVCLNQHVCCHGHPEQVSNDPAYLQLFGRRHAEALALYQHDHDHRHTIHGDIECEHKHD